MQYLVSFLVLQSSRWGRERWLLKNCFVCDGTANAMSLPRGAMGWSAVCDCGISWPCSTDYFHVILNG